MFEVVYEAIPMFLDPGEQERKALTTEGRWVGWAGAPTPAMRLGPVLVFFGLSVLS